jgi:hypothetical protein
VQAEQARHASSSSTPARDIGKIIPDESLCDGNYRDMTQDMASTMRFALDVCMQDAQEEVSK